MELSNSGKLAQVLLEEAVHAGASDLHIEPIEHEVRVRLRVDGLLEELCRLPWASYSTLLTQLKVQSGMDIAEKRLPQDGRWQLSVNNKTIDLRLASLPTIEGEKMAVRLLDQEQGLLCLDELGMSEANLLAYRRLCSSGNGLILITGPTGCGKTTTLYATLGELKQEGLNLVTIEDPVEYKLVGINQVAVNRKAGLDFATGLKAFVRQDPDIIMVGEIRDSETANMAVQAALTGHLVFSTLHTNSAVGAVARLLDMGVEPYLLAAALRGVLAQRLVRRLCLKCNTQRQATLLEQNYLNAPKNTELVLRTGIGCEHCHGAGYKGRLAVQELLLVDDYMADLISAGTGKAALLGHAATLGWRSLFEDGVDKVLAGKTTVAELLRAGIAKEGDYVH
ncbi:MAG: GspE/PulE family protein [Phascolarctobacterium sp.]|nr:GspE/PulE family protein [Phascolarctobacterium sp.]